MTAGRPDFLWLLSLAVPILAAHLYRIRRRKHIVPYLRFWEDIQGQDRWRSLWTRLKDLLLLCMNLVILGLVTFVVADVQVPALSVEPKNFVIVLDDTPSMNAEDRLSRAREEARQFRRQYLTRRDTAVWMTLSGHPVDEDLTYPVSFGSTMSPTDIHAKLKERFPERTVLFITDGGEMLPDSLRIVVGREASNVSVSDPRWEGDVLWLKLCNHSKKAVAGTLKVNSRSHSVKLAAGETVQWSGRPDLSKRERMVRALWEPTDAFSMDQRVYTLKPLRDPSPVIVFTKVPLSPFLYHALDLLAGHGVVSREQVADRPDRFAELKEAIQDDYWIVCNACAPELPLARGQVLFLGSPEAKLPVKVASVVERPKVLKVWEGLGVQSGSFSVHRSQVFEREESLIPLIETDRGPIAVAGKKGGLTFVILGFTLDESDLQLTPVFPLLMRGVAEWSRSARLYPLSAMSGQELFNAFTIPDREVRFHYENGTVRGWSGPVREGRASLSAHAPGFYAVSGDSFQEIIGVNMTDEESDLTPGFETDLKGLREPTWWEHIPLSAIAAGLALLLSLLEWALAVRKS